MRGATRYGITGLSIFSLISIHAPHARSDDIQVLDALDLDVFQSTLLMRGATVCAIHIYF